MTRAHFYRPVFEAVDHGIVGNDVHVGLLTGASVALYNPGTTTIISDTLFTSDSGGTTLTNPFISSNGTVDFYLNTPRRVDMGITPVGGTEIIVSNLDVAVYDATLLATQFAPLTSALADVATARTTNGALVVNKHNPVDATSGNIAVTLANATAAGQVVSFEKIDSTTNTVTATLNLRGTPASTLVLIWPHEALLLIAKADGSWWPLAGHKTKAALDSAYAPLAGTYINIPTGGSAQTLAPTINNTVINIVMSANLTVTMPSPVAGMRFYLRLKQDGTGSRTGTWAGGAVSWPGGSAPTLTTTANSSDIFTFTAYDGSTWSASLSQDVR
jgi:hypothetical protein